MPPSTRIPPKEHLLVVVEMAACMSRIQLLKIGKKKKKKKRGVDTTDEAIFFHVSPGTLLVYEREIGCVWAPLVELAWD